MSDSNSPSLKFIFLVQGEGRGHMTQAISLYQLLTRAGHLVKYVFIGKSGRRIIPAYFLTGFSCPVEAIDSPNFIADKQNRKIRLLPSVLYNIRYLRRYWNSMKRIHAVVQSEKPDYLFNFYEFLGGFYHVFFNPSARHIPVGHQFLAEHPAFPFAKGRFLDKVLYKLNNRIISLKAYKKLALSFSEYTPGHYKKIIVCPPLLRNDLRHMEPESGQFILGYMVNDGYFQQIVDWHHQHQETEVHCFWDRKNEPEEKEFNSNLIFHQLSAEKFMDKMRRCRGLVTTAGFESICEAMYLGKPVLMIPVEGQYEQACNALDAVAAGAGITADRFDITLLIDFIPSYLNIKEKFHSWLSKTESIILKELV